MTPAEKETLLMEQARDLLKQIVQIVRKHHAVSAEDVALISSLIMSQAMLEHEIGMRLTGTSFMSKKG